ncbi:hypothetical protein BDBG_05254 [Blastomyces gilchristii SLH14081]|uniref:F-box domain-containing protein n=1 Tax=Blastomyces gilchristii (strain SLH14081) TaxID=559298 RepID=A0A179UN36_BLAGS|nr:uncharacterized protein BDBG_05254 [Blastomyces gilchristii SLH14081]OAT09486.1 hypothetical protein BDBG_05254 [Blastomyces gilchristii SLH14081]
MGQDFCLIAPRRREKLSWNCRPGEDLFNGSASSLVSLFATPIIPQSYDGKNSHRTVLPNPGKTIPQKRRLEPDCLPVIMPLTRAPACTTESGSILIQLPTEIHYHILNFLDVEDVFLCGLSCRRLWTLVRPVIAKHFSGYLGVWAGIPVICVGQDSGSGGNAQHPDGMLSSNELNELDEGLEFEELEIELGDKLAEELAGKPVNLYDIADARYTGITEVTSSFPHDLFGLALDLRHKHPSPIDIVQVAHPTPQSYYPCNEEWVLRNLTTHEFVRPSAVALDEKYIKGPFIDTLGYGEVILYKTCWSTSDYSLIQGKEMHRGVWAGHALDIVTATHLNGDASWKDISDEIAQEISEIWEEVYGENWKTDLVKERRRW